MCFLEVSVPVVVRHWCGSKDPVETYRSKQVAACEDMDTLKDYFCKNVPEEYKRLYKYQIISNVPGTEPVKMN